VRAIYVDYHVVFILFSFLKPIKTSVMDKALKNRSGSISNENRKQKGRGEVKQTSQPGAPQKSNWQTGRHRKDDSQNAEGNTTKKGPNSI
jgi:hypothetical protein